jgi:hypothetical protein
MAFFDACPIVGIHAADTEDGDAVVQYPLLRGINDLRFLLPVRLDTDAGGQGLSIQLSIFASILVANSRSISAPHTEQCSL